MYDKNFVRYSILTYTTFILIVNYIEMIALLARTDYFPILQSNMKHLHILQKCQIYHSN